MLHRVAPASLQYIEEPYQVAVYVGLGVLDGVSHTGLGGQVHHNVEAVLSEQALYQRGIAQVAAHEGETPRLVHLRQHSQASLLDARVVVAVHVVQTDDRVVGGFEQPLHQKRPDEAGGASDEDFSILHIYPTLSF